MRLAHILLAALGSVSLAVAAHAQAPPIVEPSPQAVALSRRIVDAVGGGATMSAVADSMIGPMLKAMPTTGADAAMRDSFIAFMHQEVAKLQPQMVDVSVMSYAETFSERELADILAFYRSETGRALATRLPQLTARTMTHMAPIMAVMRFDTVEKLYELKACTQQQKAAVMKALGVAPTSRN